jgi:hypothetical protein
MSEVINQAAQSPVVGSSEHGIQTSGFIKGGEFPDQLTNCQLDTSQVSLHNNNKINLPFFFLEVLPVAGK